MVGTRKTALAFLNRDRAHLIDMIEPIRRGTAEILYAGDDGVLMMETASNIPMLACDSAQRCRALLSKLPPNQDFFVAHSRACLPELQQRFSLGAVQECFQCVYLSDTLPEESRRHAVVPLDESYAEEIHRRYQLEDDLSYIRGRCSAGVMHGVLTEDGGLAGFIGMHTEGSIGLLSVAPALRRRGIGEALTRHMIRFCLKRALTPYAQAFDGNDASLALQRKLGFTVCEKRVFWLSRGELFPEKDYAPFEAESKRKA